MKTIVSSKNDNIYHIFEEKIEVITKSETRIIELPVDVKKFSTPHNEGTDPKDSGTMLKVMILVDCIFFVILALIL